jgi:hypothetical protein
MKFQVVTLALLVSSVVPALADDNASGQPNNGTDPTRPPKMIAVSYGYTELRNGFRQDILKGLYQQPISKDGRTVAKVELPLVSTDVLGRSGFNLGDITLGLQRVAVVTPQYGLVYKAELVLNTANHIEQGTGKNVLKATAIYAKFLAGGAIFAPAIVHNESLWGESGRAKVRLTTLDFYYVPKLSDPKTFVTFDPNVNFDWEGDKTFFGLAVTLGRAIGPAFGGNGQVYIKPSILAGNDRPGNWGFEVGFKVLGF